MVQNFQLCVSTANGWTYSGVTIDVPDEIRAIEDIMRSGLSLPEGNAGKVKAFWKKVASDMRTEHGAIGTWILRPLTAARG